MSLQFKAPHRKETNIEDQGGLACPGQGYRGPQGPIPPGKIIYGVSRQL